MTNREHAERLRQVAGGLHNPAASGLFDAADLIEQQAQTIEKFNHWHRRAQKAEAELCVTAEARARQGMSIGRRLAGATWQHYKDRAEQAEAKVEQQAQAIASLEIRLGDICDAHEEQFIAREAAEQTITTLRAQLRAAFEAGWHDGIDYGAGDNTCADVAERFERFHAALAAVSRPHEDEQNDLDYWRRNKP